MGGLNKIEKAPMQSRKFLAYLLAEATWKAALIVLLIIGMKESQIDAFVGSIALAIVVVAGFVEALYIGGQASIDKYTRIAEIAVSGGQKMRLSDKGKVEFEDMAVKAPRKKKPTPETPEEGPG